jgi:ankyrin repeat protein
MEAGLNDIEARSNSGHTPVLVTASNGCVSAVEYLVDLGADVRAVGKDGLSISQLVEKYNNNKTAMFELFAKKNIPIN